MTEKGRLGIESYQSTAGDCSVIKSLSKPNRCHWTWRTSACCSATMTVQVRSKSSGQTSRGTKVRQPGAVE